MTGAVADVFVGVRVFPLPQPDQYRKIPFRAQSVRTTGRAVFRCRSNCLSNSAKKNVLFRRIGPPTRTVASWRWMHVAWVGFHCPLSTTRLLLQVLASSAELRTDQTALPCN